MRTRFSSRALIALLLALSLIAAACGGSDDSTETASSDSSNQTDDSSGGSSGSSDDDADDSTDGDDEEPTEEEPEEEPADDPPSDTPPSGAAAAFCARYQENQVLADQVDFFDPEALRDFLMTSRRLLGEAISDAPPELVPDLTLTFDSFAEFQAILEEVDYDFFAAADQIEELTTAPELEAADARVEAWIEANCDEVDDDESSLNDSLTTPEGFEAILGSEAGRELFITGMIEGGEITRDQAECMLDNLEPEMLSALATNPDAIDAQSAVDLLDVLAGCGIDITAFG